MGTVLIRAERRSDEWAGRQTNRQIDRRKYVTRVIGAFYNYAKTPRKKVKIK